MIQYAKTLLGEAAKTYWIIVRISVPILIVTKILQDIGVVSGLSGWLEPLMKPVGLPGEMALVWTTAMVTNLYGGMLVFTQLAPEVNVSAAQITVLTTMMLIAHALPIELRITQKAGPRMRVMGLLRISTALAVGWSLNQIFTRGGLLQQTGTTLLREQTGEFTWLEWSGSQAINLGMIFCIILALLVLLRILKRLGVISVLNRLLAPILRLLGMSGQAAPLTIIGMTLGLGYGGGLIIQQARSGKLAKRDVFYSLMLMNLSHGLIEDTLLMTAMGGHVWGILLGRLIGSLVVVFVAAKLLRGVSDKFFDRHLFRSSSTGNHSDE